MKLAAQAVVAVAAFAAAFLAESVRGQSFPTNVPVAHVDFTSSSGLTLDSGNIVSIQMAQDTVVYGSNRVRGAN